jgi:hypothetical protein
MEEYSKMYLRELGLEEAESINPSQDKWQAHAKTMTSLRDP